MTNRFDPPTSVTLRRGLMRRGQDLATKLAELMAGTDGDRLLRALGLDAKPGARPEEILRAALEQVEQRRRWLDADDDRYGRCDVCGVDLGAASLLEMPWADRCQAHPPGAARP
ncbi:MAG: hypothetical protein IPH80_07100 [Myxococcales bacterium]|mgnify:CR=1 FL=1|nr:hypothetical protein [Myxococcales bacterium]MBP6848857.1 hypothetical protein [Kofleriaceae bacterium]